MNLACTLLMTGLAAGFHGTVPSQDPADAVVVDCPISEVRVFPDGALAVHRREVVLPAGRSRVELVLDAALGDADPEPEGLHLHARGARLVQSRVFASGPRPGEAELAERARAIEERGARVGELEGMLAELGGELERLDSMGLVMIQGADVSDTEALERLLEFIEQRRERTMEAFRTLEARLRSARGTLEALRRERATLLEGPRRLLVHLDLEVPEPGPVEVSASRFLEQAGWRTEVIVDRSTERETAEVAVLGRVVNDTPQAWTQVQLVLSTDGRVDFELLDGIGEATIDVRKDDDPTDQPPDAGIEVAGSSLRAVHVLPTPVDVPAGGDRLLLLDRFETPCTPRYLTRPTVAPHCHVQTTLRNEGGQLVQAASVSLREDGVVRGRTRIDALPAGAEFTLGWGIMPNVEITRELVERRSTNTGLLGGGRLTTLRYRISARNLTSEPIELVIEDPRTEPLNDQIKVTVTESSLPLVRFGPEDRTLRWIIDVPPTGTDDAPSSVEWTVEVAHSSDLKTTPIPE